MADSPGQILQKARLQKGLTPADVAKGTRMRPSQVLDLENDNFASFGSITYARNFIQLYAKFLDVDVRAALEKLVVPDRIGVDDYQYLKNQVEADVAYRPARSFARKPARAIPAINGKWLLAAIIAVPFVIFGGVLIVNLTRIGLVTPEPAAPLTEVPVAAATPSLVPSLAATPPPAATPASTPVSLWEDEPTPTPAPTATLTPTPTAVPTRVPAPTALPAPPLAARTPLPLPLPARPATSHPGVIISTPTPRR